LAWIVLQESSGVSTRPVHGLDPALALTELTGVDVTADVVVGGKQAVAAWDAVATAGRLALGYQILGAVSQMIDLAVDHARSRVQFGRPIGSFQAVRNRLADAHVAREGAAAALSEAWDADDTFLAGLLAKSLAGRAARIAATQCQQVLAGIGFTAEHSSHRFLVRALVLDKLLGSATELPAVIGARLISAGTIPRLAEL
jgi:alkylation response protein AidB-like acyl-CoA dehydrogenase